MKYINLHDIVNIINKRNALAKNKISTTYAVSKEDVQNNKNNQWILFF